VSSSFVNSSMQLSTKTTGSMNTSSSSG
jgi:hypothetical protein